MTNAPKSLPASPSSSARTVRLAALLAPLRRLAARLTLPEVANESMCDAFADDEYFLLTGRTRRAARGFSSTWL